MNDDPPPRRTPAQRTIQDAASVELAREAAERWGVRLDGTPEPIHSVQNFVFAIELPAQPAILRLTHATHRSGGEIDAELCWIADLLGRGLPVARAMPSSGGCCRESLGAFHATCFERLHGATVDPKNPGHWTGERFEQLGEIFAWLHDAVFEARWTNEGLARRTWCEESVVRDFHILVPGSEEIVHRAFDRVRSEIEALPRSRESYGLIHADLNHANFLLGSPGLKIFDFDDACFSWFAYDLIVPFYHFPKDRLAGASAAFRSLVRGYERVREFERDWLESFPLFFQWRDLITYAFFYEQLEIANLPPRLRATFLGMRERIEAGRPIAELGGAG